MPTSAVVVKDNGQRRMSQSNWCWGPKGQWTRETLPEIRTKGCQLGQQSTSPCHSPAMGVLLCPSEFSCCWGTVTAVYFLFVLPPEFLIAVSLLPSLPFSIWLSGGNNLSFSLVAATPEPNRQESTQQPGFQHDVANR